MALFWIELLAILFFTKGCGTKIALLLTMAIGQGFALICIAIVILYQSSHHGR